MTTSAALRSSTARTAPRSASLPRSSRNGGAMAPRVSSGIRVVLLDPAQDPVELAGRDVHPAIRAGARHVDLEGGAASGAGLRARRRPADAGAADQRPVLRVGPLAPAAPAHDLAGGGVR